MVSRAAITISCFTEKSNDFADTGALFAAFVSNDPDHAMAEAWLATKWRNSGYHDHVLVARPVVAEELQKKSSLADGLLCKREAIRLRPG
jgi:hypothetical protein